MVKKWIIILSFIVVLGVACGLEYNYVNNSFEFLEQKLEDFKPLLDRDKEHIDIEENVAYVENLHKTWHKKSNVLKGLIWHTGIKDIEVGLSRIKTYTSENDYTEALAELDSLIDYVGHYSSDFTLSLENLL